MDLNKFYGVFMTKEEALMTAAAMRFVFSDRFYTVSVEQDPSEDLLYSYYVAISRK